MKKHRNPVARAHGRIHSGSGPHKDRRRPARAHLKAALRKEVWS